MERLTISFFVGGAETLGALNQESLGITALGEKNEIKTVQTL